MVKDDIEIVLKEIFEKTNLKEGDLFVVGCSSSEIIGNTMGTSADGETDQVVETVYVMTAISFVFNLGVIG